MGLARFGSSTKTFCVLKDVGYCEFRNKGNRGKHNVERCWKLMGKVRKDLITVCLVYMTSDLWYMIMDKYDILNACRVCVQNCISLPLRVHVVTSSRTPNGLLTDSFPVIYFWYNLGKLKKREPENHLLEKGTSLKIWTKPLLFGFQLFFLTPPRNLTYTKNGQI